MVSHALREAGIEDVLVHTGQHYDPSLSAVFFDELGIPAPAVNLNVGSGTHAVQTGAIMERLEHYLEDQSPVEALLVYGDTNSTLAAALVAAKQHLPVAHVEAGLRSFNRAMPEEINRIVTDRLSRWLFCPTPTAIKNLRREGLHEGVYLTGDVMLDVTQGFAARAATHQPLASITTHTAQAYYLATIHRAENTDDPRRLAALFEGLGRLTQPVLLPLHPRTRAYLGALTLAPNIEVMEPVSYLTMLTLIRNARGVFTDSGGLQKEAFWLGIPCITLRAETEWVETLTNGWNQTVGCDPNAIVAAAHRKPTGPPQAFGAPPEGTASKQIARVLVQDLSP